MNISKTKGNSKFKKYVVPFIIIPLIMAIGVTAYFIYSQVALNSSTDHNIDFIISHMNSAGTLIDYQNEIDCKSIDDLKLFTNDKKYKITYGKLDLEWKTEEDLLTKLNIDRLERIGIKIYRDKETQRLRFFWRGEEIERWVR